MSHMSDYALETRTWGQAAEDAALDARDLDRWITREDPALNDEPTAPLCPICNAELAPFSVRVYRPNGPRWYCKACDAIWREGDLRIDPQESTTGSADTDSDLPF